MEESRPARVHVIERPTPVPQKPPPFPETTSEVLREALADAIEDVGTVAVERTEEIVDRFLRIGQKKFLRFARNLAGKLRSSDE
jgi:hypothetical protein